jgi:hypothetical protein
MVAGDTAQLAALLADDYSLVHITGYRHPRQEWLDVIRRGEFDYHNVAIDQARLSVQVSGGRADVAVRGVVHATINGMRAPWRFQFNMTLGKASGRWQFTSGRYSSY